MPAAMVAEATRADVAGTFASLLKFIGIPPCCRLFGGLQFATSGVTGAAPRTRRWRFRGLSCDRRSTGPSFSRSGPASLRRRPWCRRPWCRAIYPRAPARRRRSSPRSICGAGNGRRCGYREPRPRSVPACQSRCDHSPHRNPAPCSWNSATIGLDGTTRCHSTTACWRNAATGCIDREDHGLGLIELWWTEWIHL